jgi:hypothetical protein
VLDFTVGQFTGEESYRVTSLSDVRSGKSVYAKYGYGTNKLNDEHYIIGKYENVVKKAEMQEPDLFAPPLKD